MTRGRFFFLSGLFAFLSAWAWLWPFTGDGDSVLHFLCSVQGAVDPASILSPWARPLYAAIMIPPALTGILGARIFHAFLTVVLVWQTIRAAEDVGLSRPGLAGFFVVAQPLAFALASDTMTELPMALCIIVAIRLWWSRHHLASCLVVSFMPLVRPEGFFLGVIWGLMLLTMSRVGPFWSRRLPLIASLLVGSACCALACWIITGNPIYFLDKWSWPVASYASYGSGSLFHHVVRWPYYCGPVLFVLFVAGVVPSIRTRAMRLPWAVWGTVFGVHSILWWGGWFAALGLMRIQVTTAPVTALVCLAGWHWCENRLRPRLADRWHRPVAIAALVFAGLAAIGYYVVNPERYRCFVTVAAAEYVERHHADAPRFVVGDEIAWAVLSVPPLSERRVENLWGRAQNLAQYAAQPTGTIAIWDSEHATQWRSVRVADFGRLGYETLHVVTQRAPNPHGLFRERLTIRCAVLRKTTPPGSPPADLLEERVR